MDEVFDSYAEAAEARGDRDHLQVCGVQIGPRRGKYFLMDSDATDVEIRDAAFAIKEGRDLGPGERRMIELVETQVAPGFLEAPDGSVAVDGSAGEDSSASG